MPHDVFSFHWNVPEHGYKWIEARVFTNEGGAPTGQMRHDSQLDAKAQWVLTDGVAIGQPFVMRPYTPLKTETGLFRMFAKIDWKNRDSILAFANRYGKLGIGRPLYLKSISLTKGQIHGETGQGALAGLWGETHADWMRNIQEMERAISLWDMIHAGVSEELSRHIKWEDAKYLKGLHTPIRVAGWFYDSHPNLPLTGDPRKDSPCEGSRVHQLIEPVLDLFKPEDLFTPASFLVQRWINEHLRGNAAPWLVYDVYGGKRILQIIPENLLAAMWLQFARSIEGNHQYRACKDCGKWFEISAEEKGFRVNRLFCSDPCKSRDYRRRKDQALEMKATGKRAQEIAKALDTELVTVKKWLARRER